jgi:hypothetical protein
MRRNEMMGWILAVLLLLSVAGCTVWVRPKKGKRGRVHFLLERRTTITHKTKTGLSLILFLLFVISVSISQAQSSNPQETLKQYISDLQKNPSDYALREKIIKLAQEIKPSPVIPEEARKYMDRGIAAIEGAKGEEDFRAACDEFTKVTNLAPWWGDSYRNLAVAQDKSGQYDGALKNLRLYLLTFPSPSDEAWAKSLINKVEYRKEKVAKESSPAAVAAKKQNEYEAWLKSLDGARFVSSPVWDPGRRVVTRVVFLISGREVRSGSIEGENVDLKTAPITQNVFGFGGRGSCEIHGKQFEYTTLNWKSNRVVATATISDDGQSITVRVPDTEPFIYSRVK